MRARGPQHRQLARFPVIDQIEKKSLHHGVQELFPRLSSTPLTGMWRRTSRRYFPFSAIRAFTSFFTSSAGSGLSGWKRMVHLVVS